MNDELKELGLSEREVEVYITSLKIGYATTNELSKNSTISRTSIYDIFESLKKKGIGKSYENNNKIYYGVIEPEKLINILHQKIETLNTVIPSLKKLKKEEETNTPNITIFEDRNGLIQASMNMLEEKEICVIGGSAEFDSIFSLFQENFAMRRVENKITLKAVVGNNFPTHMKKDKVEKYTKIKTNKIFNDVNCTEFIYGDNVLTMFYGDKIYAKLVQSKEFSTFRKVIFDELWNKS